MGGGRGGHDCSCSQRRKLRLKEIEQFSKGHQTKLNLDLCIFFHCSLLIIALKYLWKAPFIKMDLTMFLFRPIAWEQIEKFFNCFLFNLAYDSWDFCYIRQVLPCAFHPPDVTWATNLLESKPQCPLLCALYPLAALSSPTPGQPVLETLCLFKLCTLPGTYI